MSKRTYLPLLMDRWTAGTQELTFEERGFYICLLVWMYDTGEAVKDSDHAARILRCDKRTSRRLLGKLRPKFRPTSDGLRHKVLDNLIRNGGRIKGLEINSFPTDPDPDPDPEEEKRKTKKSNQKKVASQPSTAESPRSRRPPPSASTLVIPDGLCQQSWEAYIQYRRESRKPTLKPVSQTRLMRWLVDQGTAETQAAIVDQSIRNSWTGLFELKPNSKVNGNDHYDRPIRGSADWYAERRKRRMDELEATEVLGVDDGPVRGETLDGEAWREDE